MANSDVGFQSKLKTIPLSSAFNYIFTYISIQTFAGLFLLVQSSADQDFMSLQSENYISSLYLHSEK